MSDEVKPFTGFVEFSMRISKASLDQGVMRWSAINSDTEYDSYQERMSLELYQDFVARILNEEEIPLAFRSVACSEYWCGGMPYLSVSHYPDLNGQAVPGEPLELFVDGNKLKAKGILFDSPLGHSVWRSLKEDKVKSPEEKIRISIGFLDLAHRHGDGELWVREGLYDLCPKCMEGEGDKVYTKGYLVHLALTRVPVNKRTEMLLEEKSMPKKTRKDDATSIVGKDRAEEWEAKVKTTAMKSDALVEMSDGTTPQSAPVPYIEPEDGEESDEPKDAGEGEEAKVEASVAVKKFEDATMDAVVNAPPTYVDNLPYGGAVSMRDAEKYVESKNEAIYLMDMWSIFSNVVWNIMERADISDKRATLNVAVDEFKNVLTAKAMLTFSATVEKSVDEHALQPALDALLEHVDNSITLSDADKASVLNPALQQLGADIMEYLSQKSVTAPAPDKDNETLLQEIQKLIQPISSELSSLTEKVGILESKSGATNVKIESRIPRPKTLSSELVQKATPVVKQDSLKALIRKSVGIIE